jgi:hypothetical protein
MLSFTAGRFRTLNLALEKFEYPTILSTVSHLSKTEERRIEYTYIPNDLAALLNIKFACHLVDTCVNKPLTPFIPENSMTTFLLNSN